MGERNRPASQQFEHPDSCPSELEWVEWLEGTLEPAAARELTSHLETCSRCREADRVRREMASEKLDCLQTELEALSEDASNELTMQDAVGELRTVPLQRVNWVDASETPQAGIVLGLSKGVQVAIGVMLEDAEQRVAYAFGLNPETPVDLQFGTHQCRLEEQSTYWEMLGNVPSGGIACELRWREGRRDEERHGVVDVFAAAAALTLGLAACMVLPPIGSGLSPQTGYRQRPRVR